MTPPLDTAIATDPDPDRRALNARLDAFGIRRDYGRRHALRHVRQPRRVISIGRDIHNRERFLARPAARAWARMHAAAADDGVTLQVVSAYRSVDYQCGIIERKLAAGQPIGSILAVSAAPGFSEHHSGRALDLTCPGFAPLEEAFERSSAFAWLMRNAARFRFSLSYPRGNVHGIAYEPWHWCWHRA